MQVSNFGGTFDRLILWFFFMKFSQKMPLYFFYTMVQKSQRWPKTQIKGGSCLKSFCSSFIDFNYSLNRLLITHTPHAHPLPPSLNLPPVHLSFLFSARSRSFPIFGALPLQRCRARSAGWPAGRLTTRIAKSLPSCGWSLDLVEKKKEKNLRE